MKSVFNTCVRAYLSYRYSKRISKIKENPTSAQSQLLRQLLHIGAHTEYGKEHHFAKLKTEQEYKQNVPLVSYNDTLPYIEKMMDGARNILWPGIVNRYAKSSGTTAQRSKYIPFTKKSHKYNHVASSWDTMAILYNNDTTANIFEQKSIIMGGSITHEGKNKIGDVSALLLADMHWAGRPFYTPDFKTATLDNWEDKIDIMVEKCSKENVVMLGGVPTWTMVLCKKMLEVLNKENMHQIWPNLKYYMHGGVSFEPYRDQFDTLFGKKVDYYEVYNASEGYFAVSDSPESNGMLLLTNNDIYYEFIPFANGSLNKADSKNLNEVELGVTYALVITTSAGLWRYLIGDTIEFTSLMPPRIKVKGRTQQYINVFGEEVMVGDTDLAITKTCINLKCKMSEYTVGPKLLSTNEKGRHIWMIEFENEPQDLPQFEKELDLNLRMTNSDYDAKRSNDLALTNLEVIVLAKGTFHDWMKLNGKYGGQNKVPRLSNDLKIIEDIRNTML